MAYIKNNWVDREGTTRYFETVDDDGALIFTPDYEKVTEIGTPVNADNMNHIEDGIEDHENRITVLEEAGDASNFLNKSQITNCLLEVPQNIKLELNNGTLTLKAGSVVIVPNGFEADGVTPRFDYVTVESDKTYTATNNGTYALFYTPTTSTLNGGLTSVLGSGTSVPTTGDRIYYKTDTNTLAYYNNGALQHSRSFPLALFTVSNNTITSINQTFNGLGYIGSTIWVDKGVKGLIPNGRNEDGTLRNIEFTTDKVSTLTPPISLSYGSIPVILYLDNQVLYNGLYKYDEKNNLIYDGTTLLKGVVVGLASLSNSVVTSFNPKLPFRAVDYSDSSTVSGWGMPSDRYIDLTLGASGSFYTAPANGYVAFQRASSGSSQQLGLGLVNSVRFNCYSSASSQLLSVSIPVRAGQSFFASYQGAGETSMFRFIYAQGEV